MPSNKHPNPAEQMPRVREGTKCAHRLSQKKNRATTASCPIPTPRNRRHAKDRRLARGRQGGRPPPTNPARRTSRRTGRECPRSQWPTPRTWTRTSPGKNQPDARSDPAKNRKMPRPKRPAIQGREGEPSGERPNPRPGRSQKPSARPAKTNRITRAKEAAKDDGKEGGREGEEAARDPARRPERERTRPKAGEPKAGNRETEQASPDTKPSEPGEARNENQRQKSDRDLPDRPENTTSSGANSGSAQDAEPGRQAPKRAQRGRAPPDAARNQAGDQTEQQNKNAPSNSNSEQAQPQRAARRERAAGREEGSDRSRIARRWTGTPIGWIAASRSRARTTRREASRRRRKRASDPTANRRRRLATRQRQPALRKAATVTVSVSVVRRNSSSSNNSHSSRIRISNQTTHSPKPAPTNLTRSRIPTGDMARQVRHREEVFHAIAGKIPIPATATTAAARAAELANESVAVAKRGKPRRAAGRDPAPRRAPRMERRTRAKASSKGASRRAASRPAGKGRAAPNVVRRADPKTAARIPAKARSPAKANRASHPIVAPSPPRKSRGANRRAEVSRARRVILRARTSVRSRVIAK